MRKEKWSYDGKWFSFWFSLGFRLSFKICGYFDNRPQININFPGFYLVIKLPFYNSWTSECDPPKWGIAYHNQTFWVYLGGKGNGNGGNKWWTVQMPWTYTWVRTSKLKKDGDWVHDTKKTPKRFYQEGWKDILWSETYPYKYVRESGEVQERMATVQVEEREWRMIFLQWTPLFAKVRKSIDVSFNEEVGERTGSWKGGCTGCGWDLLPNESPRYALNRMEMERVFN